MSKGVSREPENRDARWAEVKALFSAALALDPSERQAYLEEQCGTDDALRQEVESLLQAYEDTGHFLEEPVESLRELSDQDPSDIETDEAPETGPKAGDRVGAYRLEKEIGRGGMGAVFLAVRADSEFVKRVAIKLIRSERENAFTISRFRHERQILARMENAYIARLIDGGTTEGGLPYLVMEYVEGQPITTYCEENPLSTRDRLELFLNVCAAVQYAHERNIIHRDLKPSNILVKNDRCPKLLDFGIAKIFGAGLPGATNEATIAGFRMLTPAYASPEQMRGDPATVRSDVYSLGVILYELLCGERPRLDIFESSVGPDRPEAHLSPQLRAIIYTAIRWNPEQRYSSVEALAGDIKFYLEGLPPKAMSRAALEGTETELISIAILPFRRLDDHTTSTPNAFLGLGITDVLVSRLSRVERLSVRPTSAVMKYSERGDFARIAKELRVKYILEGSIQTVGESVRVSVQLVFAEGGKAVWAASFDERAKDLLKLEDSISEQVASALIPQLTREEREQLSRSGTANGRAHEAYLRGRWHWSRSAASQEELAQALVCFMEAISEDPNYARAHAGVADYYLRLGLWGGMPPSESFAAAIQFSETALRLDPALSEAHAALAFALWAYEQNYEAAEKHFNLAIIRNPDYASAHHWFGLLNSARNRPELAIANLERAFKIDPNSPVIAAALGFVYYNSRQYAKSLEFLLQAARDLKDSAVVQGILAWCYLKIGDTDSALKAAQLAAESSERNGASLAALAHAEAARGDMEAVRKLRDEIESTARDHYVSAYERASVHLALQDTSCAIKCLEKALADRDWWISWIAVDPRWDSIRKEPGFVKLVARVQPAATRTTGNASRRRQWIAGLLVAAPAIFLLVTYLVDRWQNRREPAPFSHVKVAKLTIDGTVQETALSPDGNYVAYTAVEGGDVGLFLRDRRSSTIVQLVSDLQGVVGGLSFTNHGSAISFLNFPFKQPSLRKLYVIPVSGGTPRQILGIFPGPVSISSDGAHVASVQPDLAAGIDELWVTDLGGGQRRKLASYKYPDRFVTSAMPAWSPDGKLIAYGVEQTDAKGFQERLAAVDTQTGEEHRITSPRWQRIQAIAWSKDKSGLVIVGRDQEASFQQVWYLPYSGGEPRRLGDELVDYTCISLNAENSEIASVQFRTLSNIYIARPGSVNSLVQMTRGNGRYFDLGWMPDGRMLYASDASGSADLWMMSTDGRQQRQITFGTGRSYAPVSSPDGKMIAFHSNRSGNWQIWRISPDGRDLKQLTTGRFDSNWPQFTPDGKFVVFHRTGLNGTFNIWKAPVTPGSAVQLTTALTIHPAVSPKDGRIASWYSQTVDHTHWQLAIFGPGGGQPISVFDPVVPVRPEDTTVRWTPASDAITFVGYENGVPNLWLQPVNGRAPKRLTSFSSGDIFSYDWSRDGKLAYSHGMTTADVVLIRDADASRKDVRGQGGQNAQP